MHQCTINNCKFGPVNFKAFPWQPASRSLPYKHARHQKVYFFHSSQGRHINKGGPQLFPSLQDSFYPNQRYDLRCCTRKFHFMQAEEGALSRQSVYGCVIGKKVRFDLLLGGSKRSTGRICKKCADLFMVYVIRGRREKSVVDGNNRV